MATDINIIEKNIRSIYDFRDKTVIQIGAGGGQLIGCAKDSKSIIAIDNDTLAIGQLKKVVKENGQSNRISIVEGTIDSINHQADLVFFEFCLHEINKPDLALRQAQNLASDILIVDHHPDSAWAWYTCETQKSECSWSVVQKHNPIYIKSFKAIQYFFDYSELFARLAPLGDLAIQRIQKFETQNDIEIDMIYSVALLKRLSFVL